MIKVLKGLKMLNDYVILHLLGEGSYGKVKLAIKIVDNVE